MHQTPAPDGRQQPIELGAARASAQRLWSPLAHRLALSHAGSIAGFRCQADRVRWRQTASARRRRLSPPFRSGAGADLALYRPLFEANREQGLDALALNAPTELTRAIGRDGIESLTPELAAELPELDLDDAEHREHVFGLFGLTPDDPAAASLENVYRAQVTWDETMAQTASEWLTADDDRRVLAFAGTAHCHESAIPRRVTRRTGIEMLSATPVLASELAAFPGDWAGYELLIVLED